METKCLFPGNPEILNEFRTFSVIYSFLCRGRPSKAIVPKFGNRLLYLSKAVPLIMSHASYVSSSYTVVLFRLLSRLHFSRHLTVLQIARRQEQ